MRDHSTKCFCGKPGIDVSFAPFDRDERLTETEHILELLMESRFGPGRPYLHFENCCDTRWWAGTTNYDLMPSWPFPFEAALRSADVSVKDINSYPPDLSLTITAAARARSPTTLARGSPQDHSPYIVP